MPSQQDRAAAHTILIFGYPADTLGGFVLGTSTLT